MWKHTETSSAQPAPCSHSSRAQSKDAQPSLTDRLLLLLLFCCVVLCCVCQLNPFYLLYIHIHILYYEFFLTLSYLLYSPLPQTFLSLCKEFKTCLQQYSEMLKSRCPVPVSVQASSPFFPSSTSAGYGTSVCNALCRALLNCLYMILFV